MGDQDAFTRLTIAWHRRVFRWALVLAGEGDEAEDVTQEVFIVVHRHLRRFRGDAPFSAWLYRITSRTVASRRRTERRRLRLRAARQSDERLVYLTDPGARVDREVPIAKVREAFEQLSPRQQEIVDLIDLQGYSPATVAMMTGLSPSTIRVHLFHGRSALRARILHPSSSER